MFGKKKHILLIFCLIFSLFCSSCGISDSSKDSNEKDYQQISSETESQGTESLEDESQVLDSSEMESTEVDATEVKSTETETEDDSQKLESDEDDKTETGSQKPESSEDKNSDNKQNSDSNDKKEDNTQKPASSENKDNNTSDSQAPESSENKNESSSQTPPSNEPTLSEEEQLAKDVVDQIISPGMSDFQKAITIHDWLTFNIDYDFSYSNYDVASTLKTRKAVCQGYALTFEMMAEMAGLEAAFISGTADNGTGYQSHAWNRVKVNGTWYNVDTTWDDPASSGKNPSDHSANRYDYFLISDAQLNKDHKASSIPSDCGSCPSTYDRLTIYKYAVNSGKHGNVALATNAEELNVAIEKYMNKEKSSFWLWYYNTSVTEATMWDEMYGMIAACRYPAETTLAYPPVNGLTKYQMSVTPMSAWNAIPVVTNGTEFENLHNSNLANGVTEYTVRYESADGILNFGMAGGFSYSTTAYNNGVYNLLMISPY